MPACDNAPMESFFASLKKELVHLTVFATRQQAKAAIFKYIEVFYNRQRRHSAIQYKTPCQVYQKGPGKWLHTNITKLSGIRKELQFSPRKNPGQPFW